MNLWEHILLLQFIRDYKFYCKLYLVTILHLQVRKWRENLAIYWDFNENQFYNSEYQIFLLQSQLGCEFRLIQKVSFFR
ncbi:unnamed protein product [Paramecium sonneborni]|uniref:Uncharacterized protein n=1 Tax=Paramecium sonneborni TaxID=65129 RepID=A0A8S1RES2_9CILI|nr:unnamed protein product [Paramecium sonneborni]